MKFIIFLISSVIFLTSCSSMSKEASRPSIREQSRTGSDSKSLEHVSDLSESTAENEEFDADEQPGASGYLGDDASRDTDLKSEIPADEPVESAKRMDLEKKQVEPEFESFAVGKSQGEYPDETDSIVADELNAPAEHASENLALNKEDREMNAKDKGLEGGGGTARVRRDERTTEESTEAPMMPEPQPPAPESEQEKEVSLQEFRIRSRFPEIIFYHPNLITDINGETGFTFPAQDAITEYAIDVHAASEDGEWGYGQSSFKTFQPFFIEFNPPTRIYTRDKLELNAAIFNYLDKPMTVNISADISGGISLDTDSFPPITVNAKTVVDYPITVSANKTGKASITLTAISSDTRDSIRRSITVLPNYPEKPLNHEGMLKSGGDAIEIQIPQDAETMPNDFTLRILSDTTLGALTDLRKLENEPHGSLTRSLAIWLSAISAYDQLDKKALLDDDLKNELNQSIDSAWLRILAFRH
ncbi:MAG: alpha-2-macroglobulin family protein, partial [bacterium]